MRDVFILGSGQTAVGEHWDLSLRQLARAAVSAALNAASPARPQALFVGNMLAGQLSGQQLQTLAAAAPGRGGKKKKFSAITKQKVTMVYKNALRHMS